MCVCSRVNGKREKSGITILASCKSTLRNFLMSMHSIENEGMQITTWLRHWTFAPKAAALAIDWFLLIGAKFMSSHVM